MSKTHKWNIKLPSGNLKCAKCGLIKEAYRTFRWTTKTLPTGRKVKKKIPVVSYFYKRGNNYIMDSKGWSYARKVPPCGTNESEHEIVN